MRPTLWTLNATLATLMLFACVLGARSEERSPEAQIWFEKGLGLDVGADGAPDAVQAFAAMRRAAQAGDAEAAFNVAVMLDSGRGSPRDVTEAAVWYARAAARGERRGAFNLGLLYESGEGVPANVDLSRAWYAASNLPAARDHLAGLRRAPDRPARIQAPDPLFPATNSTLGVGDQYVELVWTSQLEPKPVRYFVELRRLDIDDSSEVWSGFVDVSSVRLSLPSSVGLMSWRVSAVATGLADYAVSGWSTFKIPGAMTPLIAASSPLFSHSDEQAIRPRAEDHEKPVSIESAASSGKGQKIEDPLSATTENKPTDRVGPSLPTLANPSISDSGEDRAQKIAHEDVGALIATPSSETAQEDDRSEFSAPVVDQSSDAPHVGPSVLIVLAQASVVTLSDLNNKTVVIAGLKSISRGAVGDALNSVGARGAQLTEGTKSDIDKLIKGEVSAAVVAFVSPAKARSFPEIPGLRLLRIDISHPGGNSAPDKRSY